MLTDYTGCCDRLPGHCVCGDATADHGEAVTVVVEVQTMLEMVFGRGPAGEEAGS